MLLSNPSCGRRQSSLALLASVLCATACAEHGRDALPPAGGPNSGSTAGTEESSASTGSSGGTPTDTAGSGSAGESGAGGTDDDPKFDVGYDTSGATADDGQGDCDPSFETIVRDFMSTHPDFERDGVTSDKGIVLPLLGADDKPVYAGNPTTPSTTGEENFDQWYRDVPGVNMPFSIDLALQETTPGTWVFEDNTFFPIDGMGWGDWPGNNYHFTLELHSLFSYQGGEVFTFVGDDDLFVFVNGHLAIDLGGVHPPQEGTIDFDAMAADLDIQPGGTYPIDFFFAERHTVESNFRIETTIACFQPPG